MKTIKMPILLLALTMSVMPFIWAANEQHDNAHGATSETSARLKKALKKYPEADANQDGILTMEEAKAYKDRQREGNSSGPTKDIKAQEKVRLEEVFNEPKYSLEDWEPVKRTTEKISLVEKNVARSGKDTWHRKFFRNTAYKCGLSGHYTFVVIEPKNSPGKEAPLWVYLHGGGYGYFDREGEYQTLKFQNKDTYNHEESFETLGMVNKGKPVFKNGRLVDLDTTIVRRVKEGYRILVVALGDHDLYSGMGSPYAYNPKGGEVNGLQATMAAVEYTVANFPTSHVFAHGTSAGSFGVYALGFAFAQEGIDLNGVIMDSGVSTPRMEVISTALKHEKKFPLPTYFEAELVREKIGVMVDQDYPFYPEAAVKAGFRSVPMLVIAGTRDPLYGGPLPPVADAKEAGYSNSEWVVDGLRKAIGEQKDSPHKVVVLKTGHVPSVQHKLAGHAIHSHVDSFIKHALSWNRSYPFAKAK